MFAAGRFLAVSVIETLPVASTPLDVHVEMTNKLRPSGTLGFFLGILSLACGGQEARSAVEDTDTATDGDTDTDTDTDGADQAPEPDFALVYWQRRPGPNGDVAAATLVESLDGVLHERDLGADRLPDGDQWRRYYASQSLAGRWMFTRDFDATGGGRTRLLDIHAPLHEEAPIQLGEFDSGSGWTYFLNETTVMVTNAGGGEDGEVSLLDLEGPLTPVPTGRIARNDIVFSTGDGEHFYYYGGEADGYNIMRDDLDPATPAVAVTDIPSGYRVSSSWRDASVSTLLVGVGPLGAGNSISRLYAYPGGEGPAVLLEEVTGEAELGGISLSDDGQSYAVTTLEAAAIGTPNAVETRVGNVLSGDGHSVGGSGAPDVIFLPGGAGYVHWVDHGDAEGAYISDLAGEDQVTLHDGEISFATLCGDLIFTLGGTNEGRPIRLYNHAGERVPVEGVESVLEGPAASIGCSSTHAYVGWGDEGYVLLGLDGESVTYVADVGFDVEGWRLAPGYAFEYHGTGASSVLTMRTNSSPDPVVLAQGELMSLSVVP